jgi:hypothetical protein
VLHLVENALTHCRKRGAPVNKAQLQRLMFAAAKAPTESAFGVAMVAIQTFSEEAFDYLMGDNIDVSKWTAAFSVLNRHGMFTSNLVEVINSVAVPLREMFGYFLSNATLEWMNTKRLRLARRCKLAVTERTTYIPAVQGYIERATSGVTRRSIIENDVDGAAFTVKSAAGRSGLGVEVTFMPDTHDNTDVSYACHCLGTPEICAAATEARFGVSCDDALAAMQFSGRGAAWLQHVYKKAT